MLTDKTRVDAFTEFVSESEVRVRRALSVAFGFDAGRDAAADAFAHAWQNWDRVSGMENPSGYIYRVGFNMARKPDRGQIASDFATVAGRMPWVEPKLGDALGNLPQKQRTVVALLHAYEWSMSEVADLLGISKGSVQTHEKRAMKKLRTHLGVSE